MAWMLGSSHFANESESNGGTGCQPGHFLKLRADIILDLYRIPGQGKADPTPSYYRILSRGDGSMCILLLYHTAWRLRSYQFLRPYPEQGRSEFVHFTTVFHRLSPINFTTVS